MYKVPWAAFNIGGIFQFQGHLNAQCAHAGISELILQGLWLVQVAATECWLRKRETSWVCSATLEFDYRFGWVRDGVKIWVPKKIWSEKI